jgi:uncharacterized RDD family membrane protein YckC
VSAAQAPDAAAPPLEYVGFWIRVVAACVDTLWLMPLLWIVGSVYERLTEAAIAGASLDLASLSAAGLAAAFRMSPAEFVVNYLLPAVLVVVFWVRRGATPGKMLFNARIVDADTGAPATPRQLVIRYLGYYLSMLPCFLGILWVGWDARKQGWHDKLAGTVVVRPRVVPDAGVTFPRQGGK